MTEWLLRVFLRFKRLPAEDVSSPTARFAYGRFAGSVGLSINVMLFAAKLFVGALTSSVAIMADAFNNLSDAGSSVVTLVGFRLASAPPDKEHPFGHGRMEYITAMAVAVMILVAGFELAKSSVDKIIHPVQTTFGWVSIIILAMAIAAKLWMAFFYRAIGIKIDSEALRAATADSRNDVICTSVVLITALIGKFAGIYIDGYVGVLVALFVMWSGFSVLQDTISPLLGQAPDADLVRSIRNTVLAHDGILGIHDLIVHTYGPSQRMVSLHAEVSCREDMMRSHDLIDCIERDIAGKYNAVVCIHMDPVDTEDVRVESLREFVVAVVKDINPQMSLHDFRVVFGETHTNLIFDLEVPFQYENTRDLYGELQRRVWEADPQLFVVATMEHGYT